MPSAIPVNKTCPSCGSEKTAFTPLTALQRLLAAGSGLRKYRCADCGRGFQAADRRRFSRSGRGARSVRRT